MNTEDFIASAKAAYAPRETPESLLRQRSDAAVKAILSNACSECGEPAKRTINGVPICRDCKDCGCADEIGPCDNHNPYLGDW